MVSNLKRNIYPIVDPKNFLEEGRVEFESLVKKHLIWELSRDNFEFIKLIGTGSVGRVFLVKNLSDHNYYAAKLIEKDKILRGLQVDPIVNEKRILQGLNHPFTIHLEFAFQDKQHIYLGMPYVPGGEIFVHLRRMKRFDEELTKFYAAQLFLAIQYLHYCGLIYRDFKLENLLLDAKGFLKLTDFGTCKRAASRTYTFCGTPDYVAPEIVLSKNYTKAVDWWSFGVLLFEMRAGYAPFHDRSEVKIYKKSLKGDYKIPTYFSEDLRHLVTNLLQIDVTKRFGNLKGGDEDIRKHSWFKEINWLKLLNKNVKPPFVPTVENEEDTSNFYNYENTTWFESQNDTIQVKVHEF